ncbi:MAG: flagellar basal body rod protein FlgF [Vibrio sp.]
MNPILFTAAKGAERVMYAQDVRANNLAQANTIGFKALMEHAAPMPVEGSGFKTSTTTRTNSAVNNFAEGLNVRTDNPLDLKIEGEGFFTVQGKAGEPNQLYTRAGNFRLDQDGNLYLADRLVLDDNNQPIVIPEHQDISVDNTGVISIFPVGGEASMDVGNIKLVNIGNNQMTMDSSGLFVAKNGNNIPVNPDVVVQSGFLESSNVSSLDEVITMMSLTRQFEMQVKVMGAASDIEKAGNQLLRA